MRVRRNLVAFTAVLALTAQAGLGAILVADDDADWSASSAAPPNAAWTTSPNNSDPSVHGSGTPGVEFSGSATQGQIGPFDDYITENNDLVGNLAGAGTYGVWNAEFSLYNDSSAYAPAEVSMYFTDGTYEWYSDLASPSGSGWSSYTVSMQWGSWYDVSGNGGGSGDFAGSLTSVNELGIRLLYDNDVTVPQNYGIADFELHGVDPGAVPEPGTYIMLSTVLMSLGFTFGRRKKEEDVAAA